MATVATTHKREGKEQGKNDRFPTGVNSQLTELPPSKTRDLSIGNKQQIESWAAQNSWKIGQI